MGLSILGGVVVYLLVGLLFTCTMEYDTPPHEVAPLPLFLVLMSAWIFIAGIMAISYMVRENDSRISRWLGSMWDQLQKIGMHRVVRFIKGPRKEY